MKLAMRNSARSVLMQGAGVAIVVLFGFSNGRPIAAVVAVGIGLVVAAWRLLITSRCVAAESLPEGCTGFGSNSKETPRSPA